MTDADVLSELQAGNRLLKQERYALLEKIEDLKKFLRNDVAVKFAEIAIEGKSKIPCADLMIKIAERVK